MAKRKVADEAITYHEIASQFPDRDTAAAAYTGASDCAAACACTKPAAAFSLVITKSA